MIDKLKNNKIVQLLILLAVIFVLYHLFKKPATMTLPPAKVGVELPKVMPITEYVKQTGSVVAYNSVDLVARVEGYLEEIKFTDGTKVNKDAPLFVIQPKPYEEKLKEAEASLAAEVAANAYAKSEYARQQRMYKQNATSLNSVESWLSRMQETEAKVSQAQANLEIAKINYSYTHVSAPFDGRIGRHLVDEGNLVGNGTATVLANIEQINPIYVYFNLNEIDLIKLRAAAMKKGFKPEDLNKIPVDVKLQTDTDYRFHGTLDFINTGLNASTGTMEFRALLDNPDFSLLPGLFVTVRVPVDDAKNELTIPDTAVLYDQIGAYVLAVDEQSNVLQLRIETGVAQNGRIPVVKGISSDTKVIVNGLQFATPGHKVDVHDL